MSLCFFKEMLSQNDSVYFFRFKKKNFHEKFELCPTVFNLYLGIIFPDVIEMGFVIILGKYYMYSIY